MAITFPNDADGDALGRVASDGSDMSKPMEIEFTITVPNEKIGEAVAGRAAFLGYRAEVSHDLEDDSWACCCSVTMVATYEGVIDAQRALEAISAPLGGHCHGWGTFGNGDGNA